MNIRQLGRIGAVLAASAVTVSVLGACGGSSAKAAASATNAAGTRNGQQSIQAYISCLNKNGVTIALPSRGVGIRPSDRPGDGARPSRSPGAGGFGGGGFGGGGFGGGGIFGNPDTPPSGVAQSTWTAALAACKSLQPTFTGGGFGGGAGRGGTQYQAYRNCLTSHGLSVSAAPSGGPGGGFHTSDPTIAAAVKACRPLLPTQAPNPAPSPSN